MCCSGSISVRFSLVFLLLPWLVTSVDVLLVVIGEDGDTHAQRPALPMTTASQIGGVRTSRWVQTGGWYLRGTIPDPQYYCSKALSVVMLYRYSLRTGAPRFMIYQTKVTVLPKTHPRFQLTRLSRRQVVLRWMRDEGKHGMDLLSV